MSAFTLALKNSGTFLIVNGIGALIRFLGKMTICISNTYLGYLLINYESTLKEDIDNPIIILCVVFLLSWAMASIFMEVYSTISLSILQCLYADVDICNQNRDDPLNNQFRPAEMEDIVLTLARMNPKYSNQMD